MFTKKIIHRDMKPDNLMFRNVNQSQIVICDFGLAC
jgi:serine/threonine protein kinase